MERAGARLMVVVVSTAAALAAIEVGLAILRPQPTYTRLLGLLTERYVTGDFLPFSLRPSYTAQSPLMDHPGQRVTITTNALGLRGPETTIEKPAHLKRVLVLGDSYTFGVYVGDDDVYPRRLERKLRDDGRNVEVLNAGYADGWSPDEHYAWLARRGMRFSPDLVVYGLFIGNDIPPDASVRDNWRDLDAHGLPTRIVNPTIYVDELGRIRSRVKNNQTVGVERIYRFPLLRESHLAVLAGRTIERRLSAEPALAHDGAELGSLSILLEDQPSGDRLAGEQILLQLVDGMRRLSQEHGSRFMVLLIPINFQVDARFRRNFGLEDRVLYDYFSRLSVLLTDRGIPLVNILDRMRAVPGRYYPANGEVHLNPDGHRFVAEQLAGAIEDLRILDDAPPR